jgi:hypothetical protein
VRRITSALYLDFDNVLSRLLKADRTAAMALVTAPGRLIERLEEPDERRGLQRNVLTRRLYLNPNGTVPHPDRAASGDTALIPIRRHRAPFTQAGFEVIDCPRFAKAKNGADIRLVIDVLDLLSGPVRYDEVIIASCDSDFTPLLIKLRSLDRRTTVVTAGKVAVPYGAAADEHIDGRGLVALLSPRLALVERPAPSAPATSTSTSTDERRAVGKLNRMLAASPDGVALSALGNAIRAEVGSDVVTDSRWFGRRTLTRFIQEVRPKAEVDTTHARSRPKVVRPAS